MSNSLSLELRRQIFAQNSDDPFLTLVTLSHESFEDDIRLVNNTVDVVSRGLVFLAFPMTVRFPVDDGETVRDFNIEFDNVSLELIEEIRSVTSQISVTIEMILASMPSTVQISQEDLLIKTMTYNAQKISASIILDSFLNVELTSERYNPQNFRGLF